MRVFGGGGESECERGEEKRRESSERGFTRVGKREGRGVLVDRLRSAGDPEAAFVGEVADGFGFAGKFGAHAVELVGPAGGGEVVEDFAAVGQVHERAAGAGFLEVAIAEFDEAWVLVAAFPADAFEAPQGALGGRGVAIVRGEEERSAGCADGAELAEGGAAVFAAGDLHQAVEHEQGAGEMRARGSVGSGGEAGFVVGRRG